MTVIQAKGDPTVYHYVGVHMWAGQQAIFLFFSQKKEAVHFFLAEVCELTMTSRICLN